MRRPWACGMRPVMEPLSYRRSEAQLFVGTSEQRVLGWDLVFSLTQKGGKRESS